VCFAQPVIPISWAPNPGEVWRQAITQQITAPGSTGQNQNWDFSHLTIMPGETVLFNWLQPNEGLNPDRFPDATIVADLALEGLGSGFAFGYYRTDSEGFSYLGQANDFGSTILFEDPQEFDFIGLQYGETTTDTYSGTVASDFFSSVFGGHTTFTYDAYGSISLPHGKIDDVIRIHQIDVQADTIQIGGLIDLTIDSLVSFAYMAPGSLFPVAMWQYSSTYTESIFNGTSQGQEFVENDTTFSYNPDYEATITNIGQVQKSTEARVFPTLSSNFITVDKLNISHARDIHIYHLSGQQVKQINHTTFVENAVQIDIHDLKPGIYFIYHGPMYYIGRFEKL
jgi:hypothetical protein